MDALSAIIYLAGLTFFACFCWALVLLKTPTMVFPKIVWIGLLIPACMGTGHYLVHLVVLANGLSFDPPPIPWMDDSLKAMGVGFSTALAGSGFSFGVYSFLKSSKTFSTKPVNQSN